MAYSGKPWSNQDFNTTQPADLGTWSSETFPVSGEGCQAVITIDHAYVFTRTEIYSASISVAGIIGTWSKTADLPEYRSYAQAIATDGKIHLIGGAGTGPTYLTSVLTFPIGEDGVLGSPVAGPSLVYGCFASQVVYTAGKICLIGGVSDTHDGAIQYSTVASDGSLGAWSDGSNDVPGGPEHHTAFVSKSRVYVCGGLDSGGRTSNIYYADFGVDGVLGTWALYGITLPVARYKSTVVATDDYVYFLGGYTTSWTGTIYRAPLDASGVLGDWLTNQSLPANCGVNCALITSSRLYLVTGYAYNWGNTVLYVPFTGGLNEYTSASVSSETFQGDFNSPRAKVFGIFTNPIIFTTSINAPLAEVISSPGILLYGPIGNIVPPLPSVSGNLESPRVFWGNLNTTPPELNSEIACPQIFFGHIIQKHPIITSTFAWDAGITVKIPSIYGTFVVTSSFVGNVVSAKPIINSTFANRSWFYGALEAPTVKNNSQLHIQQTEEIIKYRRDWQSHL